MSDQVGNQNVGFLMTRRICNKRHKVGWFLIVVIFRIFEIYIFVLLLLMSDLVHDVEAMFYLLYLLRASVNLFLNTNL